MNTRRICPINREAVGIAVGLVVLLALTAGVALAQPEVEWERTYGGDSSDHCNVFMEIENDGYYLAGYTTQFNANGDFFVVRTDQEGNLQWSRRYDNEVSGTEEVTAIVEAQDSGAIIAGKVSVTEGDNHTDVCRMMHIGRDGEVVWVRDYRELLHDCIDMILTSAGEYAVIGHSPGEDLYKLVFLDADGDTIRTRSINDAPVREMIELMGGGFALTGGFGNAHTSYISLIRLNQAGDVISVTERHEDGEALLMATDLIEALDGRILISGQRLDHQNESQFLIDVFDSDGEFVSSRVYGPNWAGECTSLIKAQGGGFTMTGDVASSYPWLLRTNNEGDSIWSVSILGEQCLGAIGITQTVNGSYMLAGTTRNPEGEVQDFFLIKTTPDPVSVREPQVVAPFALHLAQPYPNPFNSTVTIPFSFGPINRGATGVVRMAIFDPLGRRVADFSPRLPQLISANRHSLTWNASGMPAGQYIVILQAGNQQLSQRLSLVK